MRKMLSPLICAALLAAAPASSVNVGAIFARIAPRLKATVRIPVLLPSRLPVSFAGEKLYPIVDRASASGYAVDIALAPGCRGEHACSAGYVYGSRTAIADVPPGGLRLNLKLDGATQATYRASTTSGPYPSNAYLSWKRNGVNYALALNAGSLAELALTARSMR